MRTIRDATFRPCARVALLLAAAAGRRRETGRPGRISPARRATCPPPGTSTQQTACLVLDVDKDGRNDIVVASRVEGASLAWYRRGKDGWTIHPIDRGLNIEAGGAFGDLDGDGDLDLIFGEDYSGTKLYWWENPWPHYESRTSWIRREIDPSGGHMHHDQILGDFDGDGRDELAFWVQHAGTLQLSEPPARSRGGAAPGRRPRSRRSARPRGWRRRMSTAMARST